MWLTLLSDRKETFRVTERETRGCVVLMMMESDMFSSKAWRLGFVVGFALVTPTTFAVEAPPPEARAVVADQLDAFARDDAATAWRLTAPEMRRKFGSAAHFIGVVKARYGPIHSHRSVDFGPAAQKGDEIGLVVTLVDDDNVVWSALFLLSKQGDGEWRTANCLLAKSPQTSI